MSAVVIPFQYICDLRGEPIDAGSVYIGVAGLNPETSPVSVYWDKELTTPAAQPIRTQQGYLVRNGSPARVYIPGTSCSMLVRDVHGRLVWSVPEVGAEGADAIGYTPAGTGAVATTLQAKLRESVSAFDFMTAAEITDVQAGAEALDVTTAVQAAFDSGADCIDFPDGTYIVTGITNSAVKRITGSYGSILKFKFGATPAPIITNTADGVTVVGGLRLNGNSVAANGWYHNGANNAELHSLFIMGCTSDGLSIKGITGDGTYYNTYVNLVSKNNGGAGVKIDGDVNPDSRANVHNFIGGQVSANTGDGFNLVNCKGINVTGTSVETNGGYAYKLTTCINQALSVFGGWVESNTSGGVNIDATTKGAQFYGTRFNQATDFSGAGINNAGNVFMIDNANGVLTKWMELIGAALRGTYLRDALTDSLQSAGSTTLQGKASGDAYYRFQLNNSGGMFWGSGSGVSDVNLTRHSGGGLVASTYILQKKNIVTKTGDYTVTTSDYGYVFTNNSAASIVTFSLPVAAAGLNYRFTRNNVTYAIRVVPNGTDVIRNAGTAGGGGKYLSLNTQGTCVELVCTVAGAWEVSSINGGTISFEP